MLYCGLSVNGVGQLQSDPLIVLLMIAFWSADVTEREENI